MVNLLTATCILATWAAVVVSSVIQSAPSQPPAGSSLGGPPAVDCSSLIYDMIDCMAFLSVGGTKTTPERSCCLGFKTVLKADADCICYALNASASLGLDINMTRAEALPSDCGVSTPSISNCHAYPPAANAPSLNNPTLPPAMHPPAANPTTGDAPAAAPFSTMSGPASQAAAPSPAKSGAYAISATVSAFLVIVVSFLTIQCLG